MKKGFTLLELLIVIAIMGVLASLVMAQFEHSQVEARKAKTKRTLQQIYESAITAQYQYDDVLMNITGSGCSGCVCWDQGIDSDACISNWENAAESIGMPTNTRDGWGNPFLLDENEQEYDDNPCRDDHVRSAGPDEVRGTGDDIRRNIPFYSDECK